MQKMKKPFILILVVLIISLLGFVTYNNQKSPAKISPSKTPQIQEKVKIGIPHVPIRGLPVRVAKKQGFFAEEGLDVEVGEFLTQGAQALIAKQFDFMVTTLNTYIAASTQGGQLKWIAGVLNNDPYVVIAKDDPKDIKRIAVFRLGGEDHYYGITAAQKLNLDPDKVKFVQAGANEAKLPMLLKGEVDAAGFVFLPAFVEARKEFEKNGIKIVYESSKDKDFYAPAGVITRDDILQNRKPAAEKVVKALKKAISYIREHRQETIKLLQEDYQLDEASATEIYESYIKATDNLRFIPEVAYVVETLDKIKKYDTKSKIPSDYKPEQFIDESIAQKLK